jgi:hypothetical protein
VGSYSAGVIGGRFSKKYLLSMIYLGRAVVIALYVMLPVTGLSTLAFAGAMGVLWLSTVPPTSGLVALMFGPRYMATLFGIVFLSHQVGAFLGVWLGGWFFDSTGSYGPVWWMGVALACFAALGPPADPGAAGGAAAASAGLSGGARPACTAGTAPRSGPSSRSRCRPAAESGVKRNIPGRCGNALAEDGNPGWGDVGRDALTLEERERLAVLKAEGLGLRAIASRLGRAASTISRELRRNALPRGGYLPVHAEGCYLERRQRPAVLERDASSAASCASRLWRAGRPSRSPAG